MTVATVDYGLRRVQALCVFLLLFIASNRLHLLGILQGSGDGADNWLHYLYQAGTLGFNYFEFGAVRRGLGGSLVYLLGSDLLSATFAFHFISAMAVSATSAWLFYRFKAESMKRAACAVVMLVIMLRWAGDVGRIDMVVAALLGGSAIAMAKDRRMLATALVCIGLFAHESCLIVGLGLLVALCLRKDGRNLHRTRKNLAPMLLIVATLAVYAFLPLLPHADTQTMTDVVRSKLPLHKIVDWAIYYAISGARGVQTSLCQNSADPNYFLHVASGLVIIVMTHAVVASRIRNGAVISLVAGLPSFVFLCVVANDISRWAMLASFSIWLVHVSSAEHEVPNDISMPLKLAIALALFPLTEPKLVWIEHAIYSPSPVIEQLSRKLGGPRTPSVEEALARCDPQWRYVLDPPFFGR